MVADGKIAQKNIDSVASVSLLNGMPLKNIPDFYLILNETQY